MKNFLGYRPHGQRSQWYTWPDGAELRLNRLGYSNVLQDWDRYPEISIDFMGKIFPKRVFLSSEPYPFSEKHFAEVEAMFPWSKVELVDGEKFSWYGERMKWVEELL